MAQKIITEDPDVRIAEFASRVGFSSIRVFGRYMGVNMHTASRKKLDPRQRYRAASAACRRASLAGKEA